MIEEQYSNSQEQVSLNKQFLTWTIGNYYFGMDLQRCREINRNIHITDVPRASKYIAGVVNLRGDVVTVLKLNMLLGFETPVGQEKVLIIRLKSNRGHVALIADEVSDIINISENQLESVPPNLNDIETRYLKASIKLGTRLILILNPDAMLEINV